MNFQLMDKIIWWIPIKKIIIYLRKKIQDKKNHLWIKDCIDKYSLLNNTERFKIEDKNNWYIFNENTTSLDVEPYYTYHPAWAARCLAKINPEKHIDFSSTRNLSLIASAFINIEFYDYRPLEVYNLPDLYLGKADITKLNFEDNSINSLSCMHVVEHIGLGRYGDEIDPNGDIKAINELKRVTAKNGDLLFVVPVGKPRVQFNAHRIYSYEMIIEYFNGFELIDYCLIPDNANKNINFY